MAIRIVIDAGHGGYDNGASYQGIREKDQTLRLALAVGEILQKDGYQVEYTRTSDVYQSPFQKAQIANGTGADYFVSLHRNSSETPNQYRGVQTLVYQENQVVNQIANAVNQQLEQVGFQNLGIEERPGLVVLRRTEMPAVLIEVGFINSDVDNKIFDQNFDEIALAIATGIQQGIQENSAEMPPEYGVQVGLFRYESNARYLQEQFLNLGYQAQISYQSPYYAVIVGQEESLEGAVILQQDLRSLGYETLIVTL